MLANNMTMVYQWFRKQYKLITNSIAFFPALIAILFLFLSYIMLVIDFSEFGKTIKSQFSWMTLKDATTARTIAATVAGSVLSLTVFSFSMVMILLVQSATNLSNRMLDTMIGNRFQQLILGFYIGTIVYALFILSTIRNVDSGITVPALSIYVLIFLTIIDIFLFVYFLHYITQSVKYQTVISKVHLKSMHSLKQLCGIESSLTSLPVPTNFHKNELLSDCAGYYQGFSQDQLTQVCYKKNYFIEILISPGTYILKDRLMAYLYSEKKLSDEECGEINPYLDFFNGQPISKNPYYGFFQLMEIAVKALSPGINDPGTAILSLHALADLLQYRQTHIEKNWAQDGDDNIRILWHPVVFNEVFSKSMIPIWDYGKNDYLIQNEMADLLGELKKNINCEKNREPIEELFQRVVTARNKKALLHS